MKRVFAWIFAIAVMIAASAPAYAVWSASASAVYKVHGKDGCTCECVVWDNRNKELSADKTKRFEAAEDCRREVTPRDYVCGSFFYHNMQDACAKCDIVLVMNDKEIPDQNTDIEWEPLQGKNICGVYRIDMYPEEIVDLQAKQYVDNEWKTIDIVVKDNIATLKNVVDGPVMLFAKYTVEVSVPGKSVESATAFAPREIRSQHGCACEITAWGRRNTELTAAKSKKFETAKDCLKEAVPEGFACRTIVYHCVGKDCGKCNMALVMNSILASNQNTDIDWVRMAKKDVCSAYRVDMSLEGVTEVMVKQYVNNKWKLVDITVEENIVTLKAVEDAPVAIFVK